jgi:hypothetical protein
MLNDESVMQRFFLNIIKLSRFVCDCNITPISDDRLGFGCLEYHRIKHVKVALILVPVATVL